MEFINSGSGIAPDGHLPSLQVGMGWRRRRKLIEIRQWCLGACSRGKAPVPAERNETANCGRLFIRLQFIDRAAAPPGPPALFQGQ